MAGGRKQSLDLILGACLALLFQISSAAISHTVGDNTGWTIPPSPSFYSSWASTQTFHVGDFLVFNFESGKQTVAEVTKPDYDSCATATPLIQINNGPANLTISSPSTHYYISTVPGHCAAGQKLAVTATAPSPPSPVVPSPKPGTPSGTPAAPSPKSGTPSGIPAAPSPKAGGTSAAPTPKTTSPAAPTPESPTTPTPTSPTTPTPTSSATTSPGSSPAAAPSSTIPTESPGTSPSSGGPAASTSVGGPGASPSAGGPVATADGPAGGPAGGALTTPGVLTPAGGPAPGGSSEGSGATTLGSACLAWTLLLIVGAVML